MVPIQLLVSIITLFVWSISITGTLGEAAEAVPLAKPNCISHCGDIPIPHPFGIEEGCYIDDWFRIFCDNSTGHPTPFLNSDNLNLEVLNISVEGTVQIKNKLTYLDTSCGYPLDTSKQTNLTGSPFVYSQKNRFTAMGCGAITWMTLSSNDSAVSGCLSICEDSGALDPFTTLDNCKGINCCQTSVPASLAHIGSKEGTENCKYAFLIDPDTDVYSTVPISSFKDIAFVYILLDWKLTDYSTAQIYGTTDLANHSTTTNCTSTTGQSCLCKQGYQGNPYLIDGCQDIDECSTEALNICATDVICVNKKGYYSCLAPKPSRVNVGIIVISCVIGLIFLHIGAWLAYKVIKKRKDLKRKQRFFEQNGGLLLQQQLSSGETNVDKIKLFNSEEFERSTDNFNVDRILGRGGQGIVYKGMLADGKIVAVKKSLLANGDEVRHFINEIVILSQIIHRNVVKLLGCCLETEVPLLVYEFIPNGTLSHYIQHENEDFPLTWKIRGRVAIEIAGALSYLHSVASTPIYHRDIKSSNILLDDKYRVKVADFGTSRSVSIDKTHLTMSQVQGTFGYLDPEYFQTSQFTDKSDVYSFGVVLVELLTGKKPIFPINSQEFMSLSNYFLVSMEENHLLDILDARVMNGEKQEIMAVAELAKRCLNLKGRKRPTMKEVAVELEGIFQLQGKTPNVQRNISEVGHVRSGFSENWEVGSNSSQSYTVSESSSTGSSFDTQSVLIIKTE